MNRTTWEALTQLAVRHYGQFSIWQAREAGAVDRQVHDAVAAGALRRVRPRVYRINGCPSSWRTELHADTLSTPRPSYAAQRAALRLHRVDQPTLPYRRELLTLGTGLVRVAPEVVVHRTRALTERDVDVVDGIACTSVARTVIDLIPSLDWWEALDLTDRAICGSPGLRASLHRAATRLALGRPGVTQLARVTGDGAEDEFWSWLERQAAPLLGRAGLLDAVWNRPIPGLGAAGIVDTYSAEARLVIEWKGLAFHRRPNQLQRDSDKQNVAATAGLTTLSFTWLDVVRRPDHVISTVLSATRRAAA